ncbi:MAG TPA: protein kinase [Ktedonobacteraceae bacterium]
MECPNCKAQNRDGVRFCSNCGQRMPAAPTVQGSSAVPPTVATPGARGGSSLTIGTPLQGGRYIIKEVLGQGGMGAALLATDKRLDSKQVVIKELISDNNDPTRLKEDEANFKREVVTLAHLDHPLIPNVTDNFDENSRFFMVQEYVEGENLEDRIDRLNQALNERDVLVFASQILDVLDYLAQQTPPIIHRDIKPANIIIGIKDKRAHLVDFGIARADAARNAKRKQTSALGTPGYAPPEQYQGNADPRSDLYALGATLHHLLTNRDPRGYQPFTYPPARTFNPQLSPDIESVLTRALHNNIDQRYQSASAMKSDVDQILYQRFGIASGALTGYTSSGTMSEITMPGSGASLIGASMAQNPNVPTVQGSSTFAPPPYRGTPYTPLPPLQQGTGPTLPPPPPGIANQAFASASQMPGPPTPPYLYQPSQPMPAIQSSQPKRRRRTPLLILVILLLLLLVLGGAIFGVLKLKGPNNPTATPVASGTPGIYETKASSGEEIGVSDGSFTFDVGRPDGALKTQAAAAFRTGNTATAQGLWQQAVAAEPNDAEALIYMENQKVLAAGGVHITVAVATMLTGATTGVGRDDLQGAYVAQKTYNDGSLLNGIGVILLIANGSSESSNAAAVAQQIVQAAKADPTIVGIMGWPYSSYAVNTTSIFNAAKLPIVSETASSDLLTSVSSYFFRVCASNKDQGIAGAHYLERTLHANNVIVFTDPLNAYTSSLAKDFSDQFQADGHTILTTEKYTVGKSATIVTALQDALKYTNPVPDEIYFSGYSSDISTLMTDLPTTGPWANVQIMGGDALYELSGYQTSSRITWTRLHFTTFTYPDVWSVLGLKARQPTFFTDYGNDLNPGNLHAGYGWNRPDNDVILAYDGLAALLIAVKNSGKSQVTSSDVEAALTKINGKNAFQGASGQIAFGTDGNPINKAVVILYVSPEGFIKMEPQIQGQFLVS